MDYIELEAAHVALAEAGGLIGPMLERARAPHRRR